MDWDNVRGEKPRQPPALPVLNLVETCWRVQARAAASSPAASTGRMRRASRCAPASARMICYGRSLRRTSEARRLAEEWHQAVLAKGGFEELSVI